MSSAPPGSSPARRFADLLRSWWHHKVSLSISLAITLAALAFYFFAFLGESRLPLLEFVRQFELNALDTRFRVRHFFHHSQKPDDRIVLVTIDEHAQEVLGRWPFSRTHFAHMVDALREDGARVVGFDIAFSRPDETAGPIRALRARLEDRQKRGQLLDPRLLQELTQLEEQFNTDEQFAQAIQRSGGVVLGDFFLYSETDLRGLDAAALDRYANLLAYFPLSQLRPLRPENGKRDRIALIEKYKYSSADILPRGALANIEVLTEALGGKNGTAGFFNAQADPDGVVRRALLVLPYGRSANYDDWDLYASLDLQAARVFLALPEEKVLLEYGETGVYGIKLGSAVQIHPDELGRAMINYRGPAGTYASKSLADVVNHNFTPGIFRDKIVLVGATATGIGDLRATPFGGIDFPGLEIHANVVDNLLHEDFLERGARQTRVDCLLILLLGIPLGIWLALTEPRWMWLSLVLLLLFLTGVYFAFLQGWWLNAVVPSLTLAGNVALVALYRVLVEDREKRKVRGAFQQYLSSEVIRRLLQNPELVKPRKTEITVMFSDIRGFTSISENLDAQELAELLNHYLTDMTRIVFQEEGTLDKYIGDAVMAFWGAPFEQPAHAVSACRAALDMMRRLGELRAQWKAEGKPPLNIGIGLHTGVASVGNMGSELRYGYTAMGDAVNLASRLEGMNKEYGTNILVTEATYTAARDAGFVFRELDLIRVKGKMQPVAIYELVAERDAQPSPAERMELFSRGRTCYQQRQWQQAQALFEELLKRWPDDGPARTFWKRCQEYLFEEPEAAWDGVFVMTHK